MQLQQHQQRRQQQQLQCFLYIVMYIKSKTKVKCLYNIISFTHIYYANHDYCGSVYFPQVCMPHCWISQSFSLCSKASLSIIISLRVYLKLIIIIIIAFFVIIISYT